MFALWFVSGSLVADGPLFNVGQFPYRWIIVVT
jgi:hypothetical protein